MSPREPEFLYDFSSPYSYLAAMRVDDVLRMRPRWRPVLWGDDQLEAAAARMEAQ